MEVVEHHPREAAEEQNPELQLLQRRVHLLAAGLAAGSTDSRLRNSDSLHKPHRDLGRRNIEHTVQHSLLGCWRQVVLVLLELLLLGIVLHRRSHSHHHIHLRSCLGDLPLLADSRSRAVGVDFP